MRVADEVLRDDSVLSVAKDALELVLGSTLDLGLDLARLPVDRLTLRPEADGPFVGGLRRRRRDAGALGLAGVALGRGRPLGVGDRVRLMETRPLSATKRWRLVEILEKAK